MPKPIKLSEKFQPHFYQSNFLEHARQSIESSPSSWNLYSSPTGTGKSVMQLLLMSTEPDGVLITPRVEIINGMLDKCGYNTSEWSEQQTVQVAAEHGIYTPIRLRNLLARGELSFLPRYLIVDECHHDMAQSYQDIAMYLNGPTKIGLTATPFRGTPKQTRTFHAQWNDTINTVLSVRQAIEYGFCAMPDPIVWNLLDDDKLKIVAGEFDNKQTNEALMDVMGEIVKRSSTFLTTNRGKQPAWDRPTMFSLPSVDTALQLKNAFDIKGIPTQVITGATPYFKRQRYFEQCVNGTHALIQINVVSEGVDLPIRRLIDCAPTVSPVKWMQQIGRIMRPTERQPEYYTICRNLERHGYLMEGCFPSTRIVEAQQAFDKIKVSQRSPTVRVLGTEGLNRYVTTPVKLKNGLTVFTYHLNYQNQYQRSEYFIIVHPNNPEPLYAIKQSKIDPETNQITWGQWKRVESIPPTEGFTTVKMKEELSDKQKAKWMEWAERKGLDPHQVPLTNRVCQTVFVLLNLGIKL